MRARVGDLAIARFDPSDYDIKVGRKWDEKVGLVTGTGVSGPNSTRYCEFICWDGNILCENDLPPHRLIRARPNKNYWTGSFFDLTMDEVTEVR